MPGVCFADRQAFLPSRCWCCRFSGLTSHVGRLSVFSAGGETDRLQGELVTANYFDVLGVTPALGRTFLPEEDRVAATELAIVISHDLWKLWFRADPGVLGQKVHVDDRFFTVVGVTMPEFAGLSEPWTPSQFWVTQTQYVGVEDKGFSAGLVGRLKPGVTFTAAQASVAVLGDQRRREQQQQFPGSVIPRAYVVRHAADVRMPFNPDASVVPARLLAAVTSVTAIVLLIAAANIVGLFMARGATCTRELAIRRGLGAGGWQLARQVVTESLVLSLVGGVVGLFLARIIVGLYRAHAPAQLLVSVPVDMRVVLFTLAVCMGTGLVVALVPARQALSVDVVAGLGGGTGATKRTRGRIRRWILVPQVGLSLALLLMASVHVRALLAVEFADVGYRTGADIVVMTTNLGSSDTSLLDDQDQAAAKVRTEKSAQRSRTFYQNLFERIHQAPDVTAVAVSAGLPVYGGEFLQPTVISKDSVLADRRLVDGPFQPWPISPGYLQTLGISLLRGRDFNDRDTPSSPHVAIISTGLAKRLWPGQDAIGKSFATGYSSRTPEQQLDWLEVVGVINEMNPIVNTGGENPRVFVPLGQRSSVPGMMMVLGRGSPTPSHLMIQGLKTAVTGADPLAEVVRVQTMSQIVGDMLYERRLAASILSVSGLVGLLLASIGLYGVVAFSVEQRRREISIRAALGAQRGNIVALVLRESLAVTAAGSLIGLALSVFLLRVASSLVGPVPNADAVTFIAVPLFIATVILVASYLPARRAAQVDPMVGLREEH